MNNDTTTSAQIPEASTNDVLAGILRDGARQMLGEAIEAEVADYIAAHDDEPDRIDFCDRAITNEADEGMRFACGVPGDGFAFQHHAARQPIGQRHIAGTIPARRQRHASPPRIAV